MNERKDDGERLRDRRIVVPFPPNRADELKRVSEERYLSMSAFCRMLILRELDRIEKSKAKRQAMAG